MHKHLVMAICVLVSGIAGGNLVAAELSLPGGTFAQTGSSASETDTVSSTTQSQSGAMREANADTESRGSAKRARMQPDALPVDTTAADSAQADSGAGAHSSTPRTPVGTDATPATEGGATAVRKPHHTAHWQSLLPGVMK
jgi:hypothetical protein